MVIRSIILALGLLSIVYSSKAQNLSDFEIPVEYRKLAQKRLPQNLENYSVEIFFKEKNIGEKLISKQELIRGFDFSTLPKIKHKSDLIFQIEFYKPINDFEEVEILDKEIRYSQDAGAKAVNHLYWWEHELSIPSTFIVSTKDGLELLKTELRSSKDIKLVQGNKFATFDEAVVDKRYAPLKISLAYVSEVEEIVKEAAKFVNEQYGFSPHVEFVVFSNVEEKRKKEFEQWRNEIENTTQAFKMLKPDGGLTDFKSKIQSSLVYWEKYISDQEDLKFKDRFCAQAIEHLVLLYFWSAEYDKAKNYCELLLNYRSKNAWAKSFLTKIEITTSALKLHDLNSRHFSIDAVHNNY